MGETVESLIQQGNNAFLAGNQIDAIRYYYKALKKSGALVTIVKYIQKNKNDLYKDQDMFQELLYTKYRIRLANGALSIILMSTKKEIDIQEEKTAFQQFKKIILSKHPKSPEQFADVFLDEFENGSCKEMGFLSKVLMEHGFNYSLCDVNRLCNLQANARDLARFERSLDEKKPATFTKIDSMTGFEFEDFIVDLFIKLGYVVEKRKRSHEQGLDLLLFKHGVRIAVQVKRHRRPVGNTAVQQALAACVYHQGQRAIVVTNSTFTLPAKQLAARCDNVELWDRHVLKEKIKRIMGTS